MVEKEQRVKQMVENDRNVNKTALLLTFMILGIAFYFIFTQEISLATFAVIIMATQLPSLYRAWHRMKLLLTFNDEARYQKFVRLEFGIVLANVVLLGLFIAIAWSIEGSLVVFAVMLLALFIPFIFLSVWVNRKLELIDPNHVNNHELRMAHREAAKNRLS
ncbi:hypothetical protein [Exiguobacterium alkaliphilum]|uniref:DUF4395 domain-containing protein n=1 Tax=Exiguobacterium alkaliphilum TaxID=1428684 RepID=A0ABT2L1I6_9BACL|nr:hypothetical protein [Exiguobacterium alkaliphilum]MCT4796588.1 hypothetical protein [Exiguobacterium alkaliphilum]